MQKSKNIIDLFIIITIDLKFIIIDFIVFNLISFLKNLDAYNAFLQLHLLFIFYFIKLMMKLIDLQLDDFQYLLECTQFCLKYIN